MRFPLGLLCTLPVVGALCFMLLGPHSRSTATIRVTVPDGTVPLSFERARLFRQDRAYLVTAWEPNTGSARVLVRNNIRSADAYEQLSEMGPADQLRLDLLILPQQRGPLVDLVINPGWQLEVQRQSDYFTLVRERLWALLLGIGLGLLFRAMGRWARQSGFLP